MALFHAKDFDDALSKVRAIYEVGGKGHSCGIYSFNEEHIMRHATNAPVSQRVMVRQPQSKANAGAFNNGMPRDLERKVQHFGVAASPTRMSA